MFASAEVKDGAAGEGESADPVAVSAAAGCAIRGVAIIVPACVQCRATRNGDSSGARSLEVTAAAGQEQSASIHVYRGGAAERSGTDLQSSRAHRGSTAESVCA